MTKIKLYHFTDKNIKGKLKVKYFSDNFYTSNDKKVSNVKRLFFFTSADIPEYRLKNSQYCYITKVKKSAIYDITKDKKGLYKGDISKLLGKIKKLGYIGVKYNIGYDVISLLYDIPIYKKEVLK